MPAKTLGTNIANALKTEIGTNVSQDTPATLNAIIAREITKYLTANATIETIYSGVTPAGAPESGTGGHQVTGTMAPPGTMTSYESWLDEIGKNIGEGFMTLPAPTLITPAGPHKSFGVPNTKLSGFVPQSSLGALDHQKSDIHIQVWTKISEGIFEMLTTQTSGQFGATMVGTGIAIVTRISIT